MTTKTLDQVLIKAIEKTEGAIDSAVDFTMDQAPEIIQQAMMWHMTISIVTNITFVLTVIFILLTGLKLIKLRQRAIDNNKTEFLFCYDGDVTGIGLGVSVCWAAFAACFTTLGMIEMVNLTWLKIWIAPKLWLIEYAASLVK